MKKILLISVLFLMTMNIFAAVFTSNAGTNLDWNLTSTWVDGVVPPGDVQSDIFIPNGSDVKAIALSFTKNTNITVRDGGKLTISSVALALEIDAQFDLIVENGGVLIIDGDVTSDKNTKIEITGNATFNGDINIPASSTFVVNAPGIVNITGVVGPNFIGTDITGTGSAFVSGIDVLPIDLLYFKSYYDINKSVLIWSTASETNNDYFNIEYSIDGVLWNNLAIIEGAGNSMIQINYSYEHYTYKSYYYRLTQVDYDGKSETFDMISSQTPFIDEDLVYDMYDISGKIIGKVKKSEINNLNLKTGIYILYNKNESFKINLK